MISDYVSQWARPIIILICAMLLFNLPTLLYKSRLAFGGVLYLLFCNDKKWKKPEDPDEIFGPLLKEGKIQKKTLYLVRHGESTWNDTFNKGSHRSALVFALGFFPGLIKAVLYELYLVLSGKMDSWFYDAPLSYLGLGQVEELENFLKKEPSTNSNDPQREIISILRADPSAPPSKIVCSSLRRAISTIAGGFRDRLSRHPQDKILIVPSLQEISRNPDTLSITPAYTPVSASWIDKTSKICDFQQVFSTQLDVSLHIGNKPINTNGLKRMLEFCDYAFNVEEDHIIVGGHSIWFRSFFKTFLPYKIDHKSKQRKLKNCGVVAITLMKASMEDGEKYMIDPQSINIVFGGFT
mmetsp:Transcript_20760/g.31424  ORF Transcript_20760/g.31424 Transcript_20760/m.31424 type:complete len:353 (+) Transcript_20760:250-1308(+)|eukprot:CAMPEP_0194211322 /NCGR_PEP_ID=MMETSP0156-20130528/10013_1 /TAXON_ID=33649 /ORGANISM="Thalassionema nitzschioides, Strain L26-B" /LENGTH=352 /DNA_ID=CAMNT_0038938835 /DNA_START=157 /DNA_END=1215 /DNA_ORIENTATION=+